MNARAKLLIASAAIGTIIILASYTHHEREQTRVAGLMFGNSMLDIQESLEAAQNDLVLRVRAWESGEMSEVMLLDYYETHIKRIDTVLQRYDSLNAPPGFGAAVELFRLSAESQRASDLEFAKWVQNGGASSRLRSDELLQNAFEYESEALAAFADAQRGITR